MKGTEIFKKTIADYLQVRANADEQFAKTFAKENKNIDECIIYILNRVKESECNGFHDDEIFGWAIHYYDEDNIEEKYLKGCNVSKVVVNHAPTISEVALEAVAETKQEAQKPAPAPKKQEKKQEQQLTLF